MFELILVFEEKFHLILLLKTMRSYFNKGIKLIEQKKYLKEKSFFKEVDSFRKLEENISLNKRSFLRKIIAKYHEKKY